MSAPRVEVDLAKLGHNVTVLVGRLSRRGITVTGVTKAVLGDPAIAGVLVGGGVSGLGDARIETIEAMRRAGVPGPMTLLRSPMASQVDRVVRHADTSLASEPAILALLSAAAVAQERVHGVVLMVELGDLREGVMPADLPEVVGATMRLPNLVVRGIGTNLACRSGVVPDDANMGELSRLAAAVEVLVGRPLDIVSGGNSAALEWALSGTDVGRVTDLRLGEAILLGRETLHRQPIPGLHTDAFTIVAEVIESRTKPSAPWGRIAQAAFGPPPAQTSLASGHGGTGVQSILAIGRQDVDPDGLVPPPGVEILACSSDHLVVATDHVLPIGTEVAFQPDYSALLRAMTSPFVGTRFISPPAVRPLVPTSTW